MPARLGSDDGYLMRSCRLLNLELGFHVAENTYFIEPLQKDICKSKFIKYDLIKNMHFFLPFFSKPDMSRLRLAAGSAIVKLAQEPCYHEIITLEQYQLCALAINVRKMI